MIYIITIGCQNRPAANRSHAHGKETFSQKFTFRLPINARVFDLMQSEKVVLRKVWMGHPFRSPPQC